jgi:hypothetical protein
MEIIKSITEAYSISPVTHHVITRNPTEYSLAFIEREVDLHTDKSVYVGYNFRKEKMFMYFADSVNVEYKI